MELIRQLKDIKPRDFLRSKAFRRWLKYTTIGALTLYVNIRLMNIETAHGQDVLRWSPLQSFVLANVGLMLNKVWTFREDHLPWGAALAGWNIGRLPHYLVSTGVFSLLFKGFDLDSTRAALMTACLVGIIWYPITCWWWKRLMSWLHKASAWSVGKAAAWTVALSLRVKTTTA